MVPKQLKDSQRHQRQPKQVKLFLQSLSPDVPVYHICSKPGQQMVAQNTSLLALVSIQSILEK